MSLVIEDLGWLTTRQAGNLVGRSAATVKRALNLGILPGRRVDGFWRVRREDVVAWDARACRKPPRTSRAYDRTGALLDEYGSATPDEISKLQGVHVGNARKYLAILAAEGRAHRHDDGEWFPGPHCQEEAAS